MRSLAIVVALLVVLSTGGSATANGNGRNRGYVYGVPGYGYGVYRQGSHRVQTGTPALTNGYANPFQQQPNIQQQQQMQRAIRNNGRINAGPGVWRP
jgi:hypothetical protein